MDAESARHEYSDVSSSIRHWQNMRFAQLTVFIAISAGFLFATYSTDSSAGSAAKTFLKVCGAVVALLFLIMDERVVAYWAASRRRAVEIEKELGYGQYGAAPHRGVLTAGNAIRALYGLQILFWVIVVFVR